MDYPDWVYQGVLLASRIAGHPISGYVLKHYPVPNTTSTLGLGVLTLVFGWNIAARVWLVFTLLVSGAIGLYAGRVFVVRENALWWILPSTLFFNQLFWQGTVNFGLGLAFLLFLASRLYQRKDRAAPITALLLLCFFTHLIVYAAAVFLILFYCTQYRSWRLAYVACATVPLPLWYFAGRLLTHSPESRVAASPLSHIAIPAILALVFLLGGTFRQDWTAVRAASLLLAPLAGLLAALALFSGLAAAPASSAVGLLQSKALIPFQLLGFTNIIPALPSGQLLSATVTLMGRPVFLILIALDLLAGVLLFGSILRHLRFAARSLEDPGYFLWNFIALFALIFFFCPPNALGVTAIDLRLAQLAFTPALFLVARVPSRSMRLAALPLVLLVLANVWQFALSQHRGAIPGTTSRLPAKWDSFGQVDPTVRLGMYRHLQSGQMTDEIFPTALFLQQQRSQ